MSSLGNLSTTSYWDRRVDGETKYVLPGHHYAQQEGGNSISTLLGSCVSACIRDTASNIGGLNHFLLPEGGGRGDEIKSARYGAYAMEVLINDLLKFGAKKENLEAKIFGGASVIAIHARKSVGALNAEFVKRYLNDETIPIIAEDLGGTRARRIYFYPQTGRVSVLFVDSADRQLIAQNELKLHAEKQVQGDVELF